MNIGETGTPTSGGRAASSTLSRLNIRITPFLFLLYTVGYVDRINISFAAPQMRQQLGFSSAVYGLGAGIFFAGYLVLQLPSTLLLQRVGARRWIATLLVAWGIVSAATLLVRTPTEFYAMRFLLGAAEAGFFPGVILYLKKWFPDGAQARAVAWFMAAGPIAGLIGGPVSGALLNLHSDHFSGWQWLFLLEGVPAVILGFIVLLFMTEAPKDALWLSGEQRQWLIETLEREQHGRTSTARANRMSVLMTADFWGLVAVYFGANVCAYGVMLWLPTAISELAGLNNVLVGIVSAIPYAAAVVAMVLLGRHSDRTGERRWHVAAPGIIGGLCLIVMFHSTSSVVVITAMSLAFIGVSSRVGPFWALANSLFVESAAAVAIPMINALGNAGGFFGPYIVGLARNSARMKFGGGLLAVGIILAVTSALALTVRAPRGGPTAGARP